MRHLPPTAALLDWRAQRAALAAQHDDVNRFGSALADYLDVSGCFLAASGRTALYMLLTTLRAEGARANRREVVLPAYTCPSVAKVVADAGMRPRLVDVGPYTLTYSITELATAVSQDTLAVVVVHPFGLPHPVDPILQIARAQGAFVIEDAAQSMGAKIGGRYAGTFSDFGLFSLGPGKPMSTGGGGFVCASNETTAELLRRSWESLPAMSTAGSKLAAIRMGLFGAAFHPAGWWLATRLGAQRVGENEASWRYALRGLSPAQAAAGTRLLPRLDEVNAGRRARGRQLRDALGRLAGIHLVSPPFLTDGRSAGGSSYSGEEAMQAGSGGNAEPIYLRFPLAFESETVREAALRALHDAGISGGRMYRKTLASSFPEYADGVYPGAEQVVRCLLTLPTHRYVSDGDIERMVDIIGSITESDAAMRGAVHVSGA